MEDVPGSDSTTKYPFYVGRSFGSFEELEQELRVYSETSFAQFWKRDSRKIGAIPPAKLPKDIHLDLIYYEVKYACALGGRPTRKNQSTSATPSSLKDCPFYIYLRATADGERLEVRGINPKHNHELSKTLYDQLPVPRRLQEKKTPVEVTPETKPRRPSRVLGIDVPDPAPKREVRTVDLLDASVSGNKLAEVIQQLAAQYGTEVEVLLTEDGNDDFLALYLQTPTMKATLDAFPEFVAIDGTFRLMRDEVPAYLAFVEDGNCRCELVAACLLLRADRRASFEWFARALRRRNPRCMSHARYVMTDRSLIQLDVLQPLFPEVSLMPAIFHGPRTFDRQLADEEMGVSKNQRIVCSEYFRKMVSAADESAFNEQYELFRDLTPRAVLAHYTSHWHPSRWEWSAARGAGRGHLLTSVNGCAENLNRLLEADTDCNTTLLEMLERLLSLVARLENERDRTPKSGGTPGSTHPLGSDEERYSLLLERQPARLVLKQMESAHRVALPDDTDRRHDCFRIPTPEGSPVTTSVRSCSCPFAATMMLPCRHVFAVRRAMDVPLYCETLCHRRWMRTCYEDYQTALGLIERDRFKGGPSAGKNSRKGEVKHAQTGVKLHEAMSKDAEDSKPLKSMKEDVKPVKVIIGDSKRAKFGKEDVKLIKSETEDVITMNFITDDVRPPKPATSVTEMAKTDEKFTIQLPASGHVKRQRALLVTNSLADLTTRGNRVLYCERLAVLQSLQAHWEAHHRVTVRPVTEVSPIATGIKSEAANWRVGAENGSAGSWDRALQNGDCRPSDKRNPPSARKRPVTPNESETEPEKKWKQSPG